MQKNKLYIIETIRPLPFIIYIIKFISVNTKITISIRNCFITANIFHYDTQKFKIIRKYMNRTNAIEHKKQSTAVLNSIFSL